MRDDQQYENGSDKHLCPGIEPVKPGISSRQEVESLEVQYGALYGRHKPLVVLSGSLEAASKHTMACNRQIRAASVRVVVAAMFLFSMVVVMYGDFSFVGMPGIRVEIVRLRMVVNMWVRMRVLVTVIVTV